MFGKRRFTDNEESKPDYSSVAPPTNIDTRKPYAADPSTIEYSYEAKSQQLRRRHQTEDDYFEDDEEEAGEGNEAEAGGDNDQEEEEEEDPLDAYMKDLESAVKKEQTHKVEPVSSKKSEPQTSRPDIKKLKGVRNDIEEEDPEEAYYRFMEENPNAGINSMGDGAGSDDDGLEYDADGNPIAPVKSRYIDPLPPIDHSTIEYEPFERNFYEEHEDISSLNDEQVRELRKKLDIQVSGAPPLPKPVCSFGHFKFDEALMKLIRKSEYTQPTPIQSQAIPTILSGRDVIGVAKTGSGKTAAYLWPMIVHIMAQRELKAGEGPIALILVPTRELALQVHTEAKRFATKAYNIAVVCAYGGGSKWEQSKDLEAGAEIVVATPGRMIDMIKVKATNLQRVTFLVLDEADRMFDMGFEPQVRSICNHVRPDRQTLMFSATFKRRIERLARDSLTDPIKIVQGQQAGEANEDVTQIVKYFKDPPLKWAWLTDHLVELLSSGSVLIFVTKKANAEELATNLKDKVNDEVLLLHGDMNQMDRNSVISRFKRKESPILVATDVAARGLDIAHIKTVVNYDVARDIDTHTHRIGRTGRAGEKGLAYTLVTDRDKEFAGHLVRNLESVNQSVPDELLNLAMQSAWFKKSRFKHGKAARRPNQNFGGTGLGFRTRPGLGAPKPSFSSDTNPSSTHKYSGFLPASSNSSDQSQNKVSSIRAAFAAQYKSTFKAATDTAWNPQTQSSSSSSSSQSSPAPSKASDASNSQQPRKKSRWDS